MAHMVRVSVGVSASLPLSIRSKPKAKTYVKHGQRNTGASGRSAEPPKAGVTAATTSGLGAKRRPASERDGQRIYKAPGEGGNDGGPLALCTR